MYTLSRKVALNPVNSLTGMRHFVCVSMATNQDLHRTWVKVVNCNELLFKTVNSIFSLFFFLNFFLLPLSRNGIFFFLCLTPSFTKAKTFAKCPRVYQIYCILFLLFFLTTLVYICLLTLLRLPWAVNSSASAALNLKTVLRTKKKRNKTLEANKKRSFRMEGNYKLLDTLSK